MSQSDTASLEVGAGLVNGAGAGASDPQTADSPTASGSPTASDELVSCAARVGATSGSSFSLAGRTLVTAEAFPTKRCSPDGPSPGGQAWRDGLGATRGSLTSVPTRDGTRGARRGGLTTPSSGSKRSGGAETGWITGAGARAKRPQTNAKSTRRARPTR